MQNVVINATANVSHVLPKVMKINRKSTTELGNEIGYTQSMISKIRTGKAPLGYDQVTNLINKLPEQNELLQLEIAHQMFPIIPPVADGERTYEKDSLYYGDSSLIELEQAVLALKASHDEFLNNDTEHLQDPEKAVNETLDALFIAFNMVITVCHEFGFSLVKMMNKRIKVWKLRKLVR